MCDNFVEVYHFRFWTLNWPQKRRFWMQETSVGGRLSDARTSMRESAWSYGFALSLWHMWCTFSCSALTVCTRPWASRFAAINESIMLQQQGQRTHQQDTVLLLIIQTLHSFPPRRILWAINITETFPRDRRGIHVFARLALIRNGSACPGCSGASSSSSPSYSLSVELLPFLPLPSTSVVSWCSLKRVCLVGITSPTLRFWAGGKLLQAESSSPAVLQPWVLQNERVGVSVPS